MLEGNSPWVSHTLQVLQAKHWLFFVPDYLYKIAGIATAFENRDSTPFCGKGYIFLLSSIIEIISSSSKGKSCLCYLEKIWNPKPQGSSPVMQFSTGILWSLS